MSAFATVADFERWSFAAWLAEERQPTKLLSRLTIEPDEPGQPPIVWEHHWVRATDRPQWFAVGAGGELTPIDSRIPDEYARAVWLAVEEDAE